METVTEHDKRKAAIGELTRKMKRRVRQMTRLHNASLDLTAHIYPHLAQLDLRDESLISFLDEATKDFMDARAASREDWFMIDTIGKKKVGQVAEAIRRYDQARGRIWVQMLPRLPNAMNANAIYDLQKNP